VLFWATDAAKFGLYWEAIKLLGHARTMVFAAVIQRVGAILKGRQACETLQM
jgi:hypothetical protein